MRLYGIAIWSLAALALFGCGGGDGSSSRDVANPTLQALIDDAMQTPVEDYEREYARQICGPIGTYFEATVGLIEELESQPTPDGLDDLDFDVFGDILTLLEEPLRQALDDLRDIDPPSELEEYHESSIAELEYTLETIDAVNEGGLFGAFGLGEPPERVEEPPGLEAAIIIECGPDFEDFFEQLGDDFFDSDLFGTNDDGFSFEEETPSPPQTGSVDEAVENGDYELTVHSFTDPLEASDDFFAPDDGNRWVVVEVSIRNVSDEPQDYGTFGFKVKDADNFEYTTGFVDLARELGSGTLPAGDTVRGQVGFEVPEDAEIVRLIFDPSFFGDSRIDITLP